MNNERNNGMKPLEGSALFAGVRSDNLGEDDSLKLEDDLVRYPDLEDQNNNNEQEEIEVDESKLNKIEDRPEFDEKQFKVGGPLTVDLAGKQMDEYSKED